MSDSKNILMVIAQKNFRDEEFLEPSGVFKDNGMEVTVASNTTKKAKGMIKEEIKPDISISNANMADYDAIVIIGGGGSRQYLWDNADLHKLVREAVQQDKVAAAICISPVVLAKAKVLKGKKSTVFKDPESVKFLKEGGANYKDKPVIKDGSIVTGRDPKSAVRFGETIVDVLREKHT